MRSHRSLRRSVLLLAVPVALVACAPNRSATVSSSAPTASSAAPVPGATTATEVGASASTVPTADGSASVRAGAMPADFPTAVPLPVDGLVSAAAANGAAGRTFDLTYAGADLRTMVADARSRLTTAGFAVSGDYDAAVKGVPSAGFVATSADWQVVVGGQAASGTANVSVAVAHR